MSSNGRTTAKFLQPDDVFKMGGMRYKVTKVKPQFIDQFVITFTSTHPDSDATNNLMTVHSHTIFKIYEPSSQE